MKLSKDNQHLFTIWCRARQGAVIPTLPSSLIVENWWIGKHVCLQFLAPDKKIRFVWAGGEVEKVLGCDLPGKEVTSIFASQEQDALADMQQWKFTNPVVIQSHCTVTTDAGSMVQFEFLHMPFINHPTGDLLYAVGCCEWTGTGTQEGLRNGMAERQMLTRTLHHVKTLEPVATPYTIPAPASIPDVAKAVAYA
ncbi:PAS domain-containing protein [Pyruvatibacter mobilis]|uniref:PAS domain-containing protein n=1 Tax=Pyruvatibacter mobilis TaxID=1712261 RepID=UPI003BAA9A38